MNLIAFLTAQRRRQGFPQRINRPQEPTPSQLFIPKKFHTSTPKNFDIEIIFKFILDSIFCQVIGSLLLLLFFGSKLKGYGFTLLVDLLVEMFVQNVVSVS